jgi:L-asparaginase
MTKTPDSQPNLSILVLGTGGTIAGLGGDAYTAAQLPIDALVPHSSYRVTSEQIAQIDSKDMSFVIWERLYARLCTAMQDTAVEAIVITHGTDTMEETAYFLHRTLHCTKPVILTGAMRSADSLDPDGPRNLKDSFDFAGHLAAGLWVVFAGQAMRPEGLQKMHPNELNAFGSRHLTQIQPEALWAQPFKWTVPVPRWPWVEIVMNYAGASGAVVQALIEQKVDGIVVAGTGNGTVSLPLQAALHKALQAGIAVRLSTRCLQGHVTNKQQHQFETSPLSPVQARVELLLALLD